MEAIKINNTTLEFDKIIYVSKEGNDENDGTKDYPVLTYDKAITLLIPNACIKFGSGTFEISRGFTRYMEHENDFTIMGEGINTILVFPAGDTTSGYDSINVKCSISVYRMVIKNNINGWAFIQCNNSSSSHWYKFYNVHFNVTTTGYFMATTNWSSGTTGSGNAHFENCSLQIINDEFYVTKIIFHNTLLQVSKTTSRGTLEFTTSLYAYNEYDSEYKPTNSNCLNAGTGHNPDGTQAHLGVYGGAFAWGEWVAFLIEQDEKYYTVKNNVLEEVLDLSENTFSEYGCTISDINHNINLLNDTFRMISNGNLDLTLIGLETKEEMVVASNYFSTKIQENIDYFKCETEKIGNGEVKIGFSIDNGLTWKSYNTDGFIDLNVEIPLKEYELLTEEELEKWNHAKKEIVAKGIASNQLETIDFNNLKFDKIRFVYVIKIDTFEDVAKIKKLLWQFDSKGSMQKMKDSEYDLSICSESIKLKPLIDSEMLKINILTDGITSR